MLHCAGRLRSPLAASAQGTQAGLSETRHRARASPALRSLQGLPMRMVDGGDRSGRLGDVILEQ